MQVTSSSTRILVVTGDDPSARQLVRALRRVGFTTTQAHTGADALALCGRWHYDLVVLDDDLPDGNAHDVCEELHRTFGIPVVMLALSLAAADRDAWLDGAEDYVVKPARIEEAIARIRAVLRRTRAAIAIGVVRVGPLRIDLELGRAEIDGNELNLSPKELQLLARLTRDAGTTLTREQLMQDVWGPDWFGSPATLDVHVGWLRRKLGDDPAHPLFIQTVRGVGFRFATAQELAAAAPVARSAARG